jgi:hypothetical protein
MKATLRLGTYDIENLYADAPVEPGDYNWRNFAYTSVLQVTEKHTKNGMSRTTKVTQRGRDYHPVVGDAIGICHMLWEGPCVKFAGYVVKRTSAKSPRYDVVVTPLPDAPDGPLKPELRKAVKGEEVITWTSHVDVAMLTRLRTTVVKTITKPITKPKARSESKPTTSKPETNAKTTAPTSRPKPIFEQKEDKQERVPDVTNTSEYENSSNGGGRGGGGVVGNRANKKTVATHTSKRKPETSAIIASLKKRKSLLASEAIMRPDAD